MMLASAKKVGDGGAATGDRAKADDRAKPSIADKDDKKVAAKGKRRPRKRAAGAKVAPAKVAKKLATAEPQKKVALGKGKAAKTAGKKKGDLDSLLDSALGGSASKKKVAPKAAAPKGPTTLSMNQIRASMRKLNSRVGACYDKYQVEGTARVKMTITRDGKPKDIKIRGKFFGTDTGACVKKAVKGARFPKFTGKEPSITYPFRLSE
ncbi:MAG: hypothetical protein CSA65_03240 [Proteobacteria bacterium]|nr:MAG: hypothetical protein CSB49_04380 [Pseudomonadota bacterium]PIE19068.1 MAG: hypothetical protein CSA65_03240 [Pseudomonadota bacterium]